MKRSNVVTVPKGNNRGKRLDDVRRSERSSVGEAIDCVRRIGPSQSQR
jgi:hypothetical protein